ncbi:MAG: heme o synthase [Chloroflexota bacterium]
MSISSNVTKQKIGRGSFVMLLSAASAWSNTDWRTFIQVLPVLFKLRIVSLLLLAATGGAFLGAGGWPGGSTLILLWITGGMAAAGSSALNQYLERDSDRMMKRTRQRPLVSGAIARPGWVPYVAALMILVPSLAVLPVNPALTFFLLLGAMIYVGLYTLWLKPRTLLNIVLGGAAGSAAVLSGSAAAGTWNDAGAVTLALLVFLWTPSHFWSLAIVYRDDYRRGGIPMLPTQTSLRFAAWWVLLHTIATALAALMLVWHPALGWLYLFPVGAATIDLLARNIRLLVRPGAKAAFSLFKASNLYLALILLIACLDAFI